MRKRSRTIKSSKARGIDWVLAVHIAPDPAKVAEISMSHGHEAACERWGWLGERTITKLVAEGKRRLKKAS